MNEFELVFVCTGNIFRSAIAEAVFRERTRGLPVRVSSAGTLDLGSAPAHEEALSLSEGLGVDLSAHRSRCFVDVDLRGADLVVGFERMHVARAVVDAGVDRGKAFTLPELTELLRSAAPPEADEPVERARGLVRAAAALRSADDALPEIADPIGGSSAVFAGTADHVAALARELAQELFAPQLSASA
jgi:protein-tyrosine phosphatase